MGESARDMNGACTPWLPGYRIKVLDGNCIEATAHRIKPLRKIGGGALPGKITGHLRTRVGDGNRGVSL